MAKKKSRDELIREVAGRVSAAIRRNRRHELLVTILLVVQFLAGLILLVAGAAVGQWSLIVPGGFLSALLFWPINKLGSLRGNNLRLQLLPELLRLAEEEQLQLLVAELVRKLTSKLEL